LLKTLAPDVIVTQAQCEVCAVSLDEVQRVACEWLALPVELVALEPNALTDVFNDILRVAALLGVRESLGHRRNIRVKEMRRINDLCAT
jgi:iron complex transport system substrate-binding protein